MDLSFAEWLAAHRKRKRLTQEDLAQRVGVLRQSVSSWERGVTRPELTPPQYSALCEALGVTFIELCVAWERGVSGNLNPAPHDRPDGY